MCVIFTTKGKALFYKDYKLILQQNTKDEPSTVVRSNWRQSNNIFIKIARTLYREVKYNFDIHLREQQHTR